MKKIKSFYLKYKDTFDWSFYWISLLILIIVPYWFYKSSSYLIWDRSNISLVLISIAGISKGFMDTISDHFGKSIFKNAKYWDKQTSSNNKYINGDIKNGRKKWFGLIPIPVFLTDGWHLFQLFHINFIMIAMVCQYYFTISTYGIIVDFITFSFLYRAFFFLFYNYFLIKK